MIILNIMAMYFIGVINMGKNALYKEIDKQSDSNHLEWLLNLKRIKDKI